MLGSMLDLAGGLFAAGSARRESRANRRQAQQQFDQQMDASVQRRVADAKKAGIHPLFALGASVGASPTLSVGGPSGAADIVARSAAGAGRKILDAQIAALEAETSKSNAEAYLAASQAKRTETEMASTGRDNDPLQEMVVAPLRRATIWNKQYTGPEKPPGPPHLYKRWYDNARKRDIWLINQEAGLDELGQAYAVGEISTDEVSRWWDAYVKAMNWTNAKIATEWRKFTKKWGTQAQRSR